MKIGRKKNEKINGERDFCFPMFFRFDFSSNAKKSKFFRKKKKEKVNWQHRLVEFGAM